MWEFFSLILHVMLIVVCHIVHDNVCSLQATAIRLWSRKDHKHLNDPMEACMLSQWYILQKTKHQGSPQSYQEMHMSWVFTFIEYWKTLFVIHRNIQFTWGLLLLIVKLNPHLHLSDMRMTEKYIYFMTIWGLLFFHSQQSVKTNSFKDV